MPGPITERFTIGRQGYRANTDLQGRLQGLSPESDVVDHKDDPEECAQFVCDLACEDPGVIFTVFDNETQDHIAVYKQDETREQLLASIREGMRQLTLAQPEADGVSAAQ